MMRAMILAAGRGERMRPLSDHLPKPLLAVGNKRLIEYHIQALVMAGITNIVINHAYLGEKIEQFLGDGRCHNVRLDYSPEHQALETGGGIYQALPLLGADPFIVVNGDIWTDYNFANLVQHALADDILAHLILVPNPPQHPDGDFSLVSDRVTTHANAQDRFTFSGIGLYRPELFAECQAGRFPLAPLLKQAMLTQQVTGALYQGDWRDIGTPERLQQLQRDLNASLNSES